MRPDAYLDHHATTPVDSRVLDARWPYFAEHFGNPAARASIRLGLGRWTTTATIDRSAERVDTPSESFGARK
jgi:cysteine desulfurase